MLRFVFLNRKQMTATKRLNSPERHGQHTVISFCWARYAVIEPHRDTLEGKAIPPGFPALPIPPSAGIAQRTFPAPGPPCREGRGQPLPPGEGLGPPPAPPDLRGRTPWAPGMDTVTARLQQRLARVFLGWVQRNVRAGRRAPLPLLSRSPCPDPAPGPAAHALSRSARSAPPAPLKAPAPLGGSASQPPPRSAPGPLPTLPPPPHSQGPGLPVVFHDGGRAPLSAAAPRGSAGGARRRTEAKGR